MTQMVASGGDLDIVNLIGNHECSNTPASLFNEHGTRRAAGTNANLVIVLREETSVSAVPNLHATTEYEDSSSSGCNVRCSSLVLPQRRNLRRCRTALQEPSAD